MAEALSAAFKAHPYRNPLRGWPSDIATCAARRLRPSSSAITFPGNITVAIVGRCHRGRSEAAGGALLRPDASQAVAARGGHRGTAADRSEDRSTRDAGTARRGGGLQASEPVRQRRYRARPDPNPTFPGTDGQLLYNELVQEKRLAQQAQAIATIPDGRYANLFVFLLVPAQGHTVEENQRALEELLQRFKTTPLDPQLLARAKAQGRANLIRRMTNNGELAAFSPSTPPTMATGASCSRHWTIWIR